MAEKRAFIDIIPAAEYEAVLPRRLTRDQVKKDQPYSLFVRENEKAMDAYRLPIKVANIRPMSMGFIAFETILLTQDLEPAPPAHFAALGEDNMWLGEIRMVVADRRFPVRCGFIGPYDDLFDRTALEAFESMSMSR